MNFRFVLVTSTKYYRILGVEWFISLFSYIHKYYRMLGVEWFISLLVHYIKYYRIPGVGDN